MYLCKDGNDKGNVSMVTWRVYDFICLPQQQDWENWSKLNHVKLYKFCLSFKDFGWRQRSKAENGKGGIFIRQEIWAIGMPKKLFYFPPSQVPNGCNLVKK